MSECDITPLQDALDLEAWSQTLHRIKTPLTLIKGHMEHLLDNEDKVPAELLKDLHYEINKLVTTVNEVGKEKSKVNPLPINKINLVKLASLLTQRFRLANQDLSVKLQSSGEIFIYDNEDRLNELIGNLLENACKYTEKGYVVLEIKEQDNYVVITVTDTGIGIPAEDLPHIFENLYRAENAKEARAGHGLGLFIVKHIVDTLHGEITVESTPKEGSTFLVKLPL